MFKSQSVFLIGVSLFCLAAQAQEVARRPQPAQCQELVTGKISELTREKRAQQFAQLTDEQKRHFAAQLASVTPDLTRFIYSLVRDRQHAEDLLQDVLLRAWSRQFQYRALSEGGMISWLITIADSVYTNERKLAWNRYPKVDADDAVGLPELSIPPSQDARIYFAEVAREFESLNDTQRAVLIEVAVHGLSAKEASSVLKTEARNVRIRLCRAREALEGRLLRREDRFKRHKAP